MGDTAAGGTWGTAGACTGDDGAFAPGGPSIGNSEESSGCRCDQPGPAPLIATSIASGIGANKGRRCRLAPAVRTTCLEENEIVDLVTGNTDPEAARLAEAHIDRCSSCRLVLIELARVFELKASSLPKDDATTESDRTDPSEDDASLLMQPPALMRGTTIGRYLVLDVLGAGAMGVVYAAFDPELDRRVALKLLHARAVGKVSSERLVREARATARLAHPNVVVVHDVGEHGGAVFMAMEYVEGGTLGEWLTEERRERDEIVAVFREAGLGLQAAHEAGLVHRDFKPANVLMGTDRRPRVTDFGLARGDDSASTSGQVLSTHPGAEAKLLDATFTRTGALIGTPAYMSPEQFAGQTADPRSDQFSFCVALFEALCGSRPFAGKTVTELAASVSAGRIAEPALLDSLPRNVRRMLTRGLRPAPDDRYADMEAMLRDLEPSETASKGTRALFLGGLLVGAGSLAVAMTSTQPSVSDDETCAEGGAAMQELWTEERGRALEESLAAGRSELESRTASRVHEGLDTYAAEWLTARGEICRSEPIRRSAATQCLDARFVHFSALVDALEHGEASATRHAANAVAQLDDPARCTSPDWREATEVDPPPELATDVQLLRQRLVRVRVDEQLGHFAAAFEASTPLLEEAEQLGFDPLTAEIHSERGLLLAERSEYEEALTEFEHAFALALRSGYDQPAVLSGALALQIVGQSTPDAERARMWKTLTQAAVDRMGEYSRPAASYWNAVGLDHRLHGRFDESRQAFERSIQIYDETAPEGVERFHTLNSLAALEMDQLNYQAAERRARELIDAQERALGPEHPDLVTSLSTLAAALASMHQLDEAAEAIERALELETTWNGTESNRLDSVRMTLAQIRKRQGNLESARDLQAQTLEAWKVKRGLDDPYTALAHNNLAVTLSELGDLDGALEHHQRALEIRVAHRGPDHIDTAAAHSSVASDLLLLEQCDAAAEHLRDAFAVTEDLEPADLRKAIVEGNLAKHALMCGGTPEDARRWAEAAVNHLSTAMGPEHPMVGKMLATAAEAAHEAGARDDALAHVERGVPLTKPQTSGTRARLLYVKAQLADGHERQAAVEDALAALPDLARWAQLRNDLEALEAPSRL